VPTAAILVLRLACAFAFVCGAVAQESNISWRRDGCTGVTGSEGGALATCGIDIFCEACEEKEQYEGAHFEAAPL
jgi:hypothetical protein